MNRLLLIIFFSIASMEPFDGYTLFTPSTHDEEVITTLLMNNDYETIHSWSHGRPPASMPYLFPDGSIIYPYTVYNYFNIAGSDNSPKARVVATQKQQLPHTPKKQEQREHDPGPALSAP